MEDLYNRLLEFELEYDIFDTSEYDRTIEHVKEELNTPKDIEEDFIKELNNLKSEKENNLKTKNKRDLDRWKKCLEVEVKSASFLVWKGEVMNYEDKVIRYSLQNKKPYFYSQEKYDLFFSQFYREEEDRKLIERYADKLQYV